MISVAIILFIFAGIMAAISMTCFAKAYKNARKGNTK